MNLGRRRISAGAICVGVILAVAHAAFPTSYGSSFARESAPPADVKSISKRGLGCVGKITSASMAESWKDMKSIDVRNEGAPASDLASRIMRCGWANMEYAEIHKHRFAHTWRVLDSIINMVDSGSKLRSNGTLKLLGVGESEHIPSLCWHKYGLNYTILNSHAGFSTPRCEALFPNPPHSDEVVRFDVNVLNAEGEKRYPYLDSTFKIVTMLEVLEHLREDPIQCLAEVNRVLEHGGYLLLTTPNGNAFNAILNIYAQKSPLTFSPFNEDGMTHSKEYSVLELRQAVEAAGFEIITHETFSPYTITDSELMDDPKTQYLLAFSKICQHMNLKMSGHTHMLVARKVRAPQFSAVEPLYTYTRPIEPAKQR